MQGIEKPGLSLIVNKANIGGFVKALKKACQSLINRPRQGQKILIGPKNIHSALSYNSVGQAEQLTRSTSIMNRAATCGEVAVVGFEEHAETLAESEVLAKQHIGSTMLYRVKHATYGEVMLVESTSGECGRIQL